MDAIYSKLETKTILIVEDDVSTLKWLKRVLSIYFREVYSACDAIEGLNIFKKTPTNIVLADIQMPDIDGLTFLQKIKSLDVTTFRIVMTAFNSSPYINKAVEAGVHLYLKKPLDIDELLFAISSYVFTKEVIKNRVDLKESFIFDSSLKTLYKDNTLVTLTKKELLLLELLLKNRDTFVTLELIEEVIWQEDTTADAMRMVIVGLRKKTYSSLIQNLKGLGYKINL